MVTPVEIKFVEFEKVNVEGYTLIEGFPGMGLVGTIATKYLVERLKFAHLGHIESNIFMPIIRIQNGVPIHPARIFVNKEHKLIAVISEQIIPKNHTYKFAQEVLNWAESKKLGTIISLSGIHTDVSEGNKDTVYGIAANEQSKKLLEKHEIAIIEDGITTGITALMLLSLKYTKRVAISILGNVNIAADYKAASELIKKLNEILGLDIDVKPLLKEAKATEEELLKHFENLKRTHESVERFEGKTPAYYA